MPHESNGAHCILPAGHAGPCIFAGAGGAWPSAGGGGAGGRGWSSGAGGGRPSGDAINWTPGIDGGGAAPQVVKPVAAIYALYAVDGVPRFRVFRLTDAGLARVIAFAEQIEQEEGA